MSSWSQREEMDGEWREGGKKRVYCEQGRCLTLIILLWEKDLKAGQTVYGNSLLRATRILTKSIHTNGNEYMIF